jgi:hypothetical protein
MFYLRGLSDFRAILKIKGKMAQVNKYGALSVLTQILTERQSVSQGWFIRKYLNGIVGVQNLFWTPTRAIVLHNCLTFMVYI